MLPTIEISSETEKALAALAEPFVDLTPEHVIKKLIKLHDEATVGIGNEESIKVYSSVVPPDVSHTKVLTANVNGRRVLQPNWNSIMDHVIHMASHKLANVDKLSELILAKHVKGEKTDQGFRHLEGTGISVQGQDANNAWKTTANIVKALGMKADVSFTWYDNPKAAKPGDTGKFILG